MVWPCTSVCLLFLGRSIDPAQSCRQIQGGMLEELLTTSRDELILHGLRGDLAKRERLERTREHQGEPGRLQKEETGRPEMCFKCIIRMLNMEWQRKPFKPAA